MNRVDDLEGPFRAGRVHEADLRALSAALAPCVTQTFGLVLRPLLEHLRYGVPYHLLILVPVGAQGILSDSSP